MRNAVLVALFGLFGTLGAAQQLVIQRVTVIDATGRQPQPDYTVVIEGDRITTVGPRKTVKPRKDAHIVDGAGKFLIPGLWDMHVHGVSTDGPNFSYALYMANGIVGVREMFGPMDARAWRAKRIRDEPAPHIYLGSTIVDGPKPTWQGSIAVTTAAQGREAVAQQKERGADFIKVYSGLPHEAYLAIADEARKRGISIAGHVPTAVTAAEASNAGQKSMEHLYGVAFGCSSEEESIFRELQNATAPERLRLGERARNTFDEAKARALLARFVKNGTWQCPTLTVLRSLSRLDDPSAVNDDRLKYMPKSVRSFWDPHNDFRLKDMKPEGWAGLREQSSAAMMLVGRIHRAGVKILAGTDTMNPYCFPGFSLHDELKLLVESGLPPMAALQAATRNAAEFIGRLDTLGTIEAGKIADLVLLDKNPLVEIGNTQSIQAVILNGKLMPRAALDQMLTAAQKASQ